MNNSAPPLASTVLTADLPRWIDGWLLTGQIQQHSARTSEARKDITGKLLWFLRAYEIAECDTTAIRRFLAYCAQGHTIEGGRWGNPRCTGPVRPSTVQTYYSHLRTLFRWLVTEGIVSASPMDRIPIPIARADQIQPLAREELQRILEAAKASHTPRRDEVIVRILYDTGMRVSELCGITVGDLELSERRVRVLGKGGKRRTVAFGARTARALWSYLRDADPARALIVGERGPVTRSGIRQIVAELGQTAGVEHVHPHRLRHSFAIAFLRSGGDTFTLQAILGHTDLAMTQRYVAIAQADVEVQQRRHSPGDKL